MNELMPHQKEAAKFLLRGPRRLLGSEMGTGKTASLIVAAAHVNRVEKSKTLFVVPAYLRTNTVREVKLWAPDQSVVDIKAAKDFQKIKGEDFVVMSYEAATKMASNIHGMLGVYRTVIFDEAHYLKNLRSGRTKALLGKISVGQMATRCWLSTGTPFPNTVADGYSLLAFITRGAVGKWYDFCKRYGYVEETRFGLRVHGCRAVMMPELKAKVAGLYHRDEIKDVLKSLPKQRDVIVPVEGAFPQINAALRSEMLASLESGSGPTSQHISALRIDITNRKLRVALQYIENRMGDDPILVFGYHKLPLANLFGALANRSARCEEVDGPLGKYQGTPDEVCMITGETPMKERDRIINAFQSGKVRVLLATIPALSVGVTLTKATDCVFIEHPWTPAEYQQARARIYRIGQDRPVMYHHLLFEDEIDGVVYRVLHRKIHDTGIALEGIANERA